MQPHQSPADASPTSTKPLRVAQWATGTIGVRALRGIIEHRGMDLASVYVHSSEKAGRDAGELCGLAATGVTATTSIDDIVSSGAECVLYMPSVLDLAEVRRLLEAGINIVTTCSQFHHPAGMDPDLREEVERACATGGASIHSTGSSPGFISEAIPLVLTSIQRRFTSLTISEFGDLSQRPSPEILFDRMGFGRAMGDFDQSRAQHLAASFGPSLRLIAETMGLPLDEVHASGQLAAATRTVQIAAGTIEAGTVAAQQITVVGTRNGLPLLTFNPTWYCTTNIEPRWDLLDTGWRVSVVGDAPLEIDIRMPVPLNEMALVSPGYTANRAVNAAFAICSAAPGIRSTADLPHVIATFG